MVRKIWWNLRPREEYVGQLTFTDREHGRTAPPYLRKHCGGCGRTLPNRSRSSVCPDCYPEFRAQEKTLAERRRRQRFRNGAWQ
jgi:hypothetical protein